MKKFLYCSIFALFFAACASIPMGVSFPFQTEDELQKTKQSHLLQKGYFSKSERPYYLENAYYDSEFEFIKVATKNGEAKTHLLLTINTRRAAANLKKQLLLQIDSVNYELAFERVEIENNEVSYSTSTTTPRLESVTVCVPSSTQEVTKSDGTKETIRIPAKSETKSVMVYDQSTTNTTDLLRSDKAIIALSDEIIQKIKNSKQFKFKIYYEFHGIWLEPYQEQNRALKAFL